MKKKKRGLGILVIILLILVAAGCGAVGYYLHEQASSGLFFDNTTINGYSVAGKTDKQVTAMLKEYYAAPKIQVTEGGQEALVLSFEDMGYTINEVELLSNVQHCMDQQNENLSTLVLGLMNGNTFEVKVPFDYDENVFNGAVSQTKLSAPRVASVNASLEYNGTDFYIQPEVYGNEMDDADLRIMVKDLAERMVYSDRPCEDGELAIPDSFYFLPTITQSNTDMNALMSIYNTYCKARITHTFGKEKLTIGWTEIQGWLEIEDGQATLLEEPIRAYVQSLEAKYNTLYNPRDFETSDGAVIHFDGSDYGYWIDEDAEVLQMVTDITNNTEVEREPIYAVKGFKRNGTDDLCGNYVEANLTKQHLWFYKDGKLVIESDFVSGLPKDGRETITGVFGIPYKKSPETLKGDTWETKVTYWMPFNDGQGLHDAPWRSAFGGGIYLTDGSHGCINLPADVARTIYDNMEERMPIFVYK